MSKLLYLGHRHPVGRIGTQARDHGLTDPSAKIDKGLEPADGLAPEWAP